MASRISDAEAQGRGEDFGGLNGLWFAAGNDLGRAASHPASAKAVHPLAAKAFKLHIGARACWDRSSTSRVRQITNAVSF